MKEVTVVNGRSLVNVLWNIVFWFMGVCLVAMAFFQGLRFEPNLFVFLGGLFCLENAWLLGRHLYVSRKTLPENGSFWCRHGIYAPQVMGALVIVVIACGLFGRILYTEPAVAEENLWPLCTTRFKPEGLERYFWAENVAAFTADGFCLVAKQVSTKMRVAPEVFQEKISGEDGQIIPEPDMTELMVAEYRWAVSQVRLDPQSMGERMVIHTSSTEEEKKTLWERGFEWNGEIKVEGVTVDLGKKRMYQTEE